MRKTAEKKEAKRSASGKKSCKFGDVKRREEIADGKTDRKLKGQQNAYYLHFIHVVLSCSGKYSACYVRRLTLFSYLYAKYEATASS